MEDIKIPTYRARKKHNELQEVTEDGEYTIGYLIELAKGEFFIQSQGYGNEIEIDPSTLAINFPDMLDSENNPIFASLSEDWKGGDNVSLDGTTYFTVVFKDGTVQIVREFETYKQNFKGIEYLKERKVIGIQK